VTARFITDPHHQRVGIVIKPYIEHDPDLPTIDLPVAAGAPDAMCPVKDTRGIIDRELATWWTGRGWSRPAPIYTVEIDTLTPEIRSRNRDLARALRAVHAKLVADLGIVIRERGDVEAWYGVNRALGVTG
jgi:hypothetical protein